MEPGGFKRVWAGINRPINLAEIRVCGLSRGCIIFVDLTEHVSQMGDFVHQRSLVRYLIKSNARLAQGLFCADMVWE